YALPAEPAPHADPADGEHCATEDTATDTDSDPIQDALWRRDTAEAMALAEDVLHLVGLGALLTDDPTAGWYDGFWVSHTATYTAMEWQHLEPLVIRLAPLLVGHLHVLAEPPRGSVGGGAARSVERWDFTHLTTHVRGVVVQTYLLQHQETR